jgi:hypothetical protein
LVFVGIHSAGAVGRQFEFAGEGEDGGQRIRLTKGRGRAHIDGLEILGFRKEDLARQAKSLAATEPLLDGLSAGQVGYNDQEATALHKASAERPGIGSVPLQRWWIPTNG